MIWGSWCNNNINKVHSKCARIILKPPPPQSMEKLSSMKLVPGALKIGDCCPRAHRGSAALPMPWFWTSGSRITRKCISVISSRQFVMICYSSPGKLAHGQGSIILSSPSESKFSLYEANMYGDYPVYNFRQVDSLWATVLNLKVRDGGSWYEMPRFCMETLLCSVLT